MAISTRLTELLGIEHPILLAPMGGVSGGELAGAVTVAGGLGLIGGGYGDGDWLEREFLAAGNSRVGCGFITWSLARKPELLDVALAHRPAAVMLSFGDPAPFAEKIRGAGAYLICQVQTPADARTAADVCADVIVAQGTEAGGHGAGRATLPLVPAVADVLAAVGSTAVLVAAGGIADGRGLAAALSLGAEGVLVGTRFFASRESLGHPNAVDRIVASNGDQTRRTTVFDIVRGYDWPEPFTGRAIVNDLLLEWHGREAALAGDGESARERYAAAVARGDFDQGVVFAGEGMDLIRDAPPAAEIVRRMMAEAEASLDRAASLRRKKSPDTAAVPGPRMQ